MNRLNKTDLAIFISLMQSLLPNDLHVTNQDLFVFNEGGIVVPCCGHETFSRISPWCRLYFLFFFCVCVCVCVGGVIEFILVI